jgi:hypothetical protein
MQINMPVTNKEVLMKKGGICRFMGLHKTESAVDSPGKKPD